MATTINGPVLMVRQDKTRPLVASSVPSYTILKERTRVYRKKPKGIALLTSPTNHVAYSSSITREVNENSWTGSITATSTGASYLVFPTAEASRARAEAILNLRSKLKGETMNLATFAGEFPETLDFFTDTLRGVVNAYRAVKRGDMRHIRKLIRKYRHHWSADLTRELAKSSKDVSKKWLMWRYAVSPLVYDLDDALSELHRSTSMPLIKRVASGSGGKVAVVQRSPFVITSSYNVVAGAYVQVNKNAQAWARLGLINLPATLWELTPLSFVVDWFIPVGDFLGSLDSLIGVDVLSTWISTKEENYGLAKATVSPHFDTVLEGGVLKWKQVGTYRQGKHEFETSYFSRSANPSISIPRMDYVPGLNVERFFDGLALTRSAMKR